MHGPEASAANQCLAFLLAQQWKQPYRALCGFVRSHLSLALAQASSLCLWGVHDPQPEHPVSMPMAELGLHSTSAPTTTPTTSPSPHRPHFTYSLVEF